MIGHSLDSIVKLWLPDQYKSLIKDIEGELKFIFIVSKVEIVEGADCDGEMFKSETVQGLKIFSSRHSGQKCDRCWHYFQPKNVKNDICPRCEEHLQIKGVS